MITTILGIAAIYFAVGFLLALTIAISIALNFSTEELYERFKEVIQYSTFKYLFYPLAIFLITIMYPVFIFDVYKKRAKNAKN